MSAQILREAAALMRERAEAATGGRWSVQFIQGEAVPNSHIIDRWFVMGHFASGNPAGPASTSEYKPDAEHIASRPPAVALAVADWLDDYARRLEEQGHAIGASVGQALAVARTYLGRADA